MNREQQILTIRNRILVIGRPCVNKQPCDSKLQSGRCFPNYFSSQWSKNMVKVLSGRFYLCLEPFNLLTVEDVLRRRWIVSGVTKPWTVANFGNTLAMTIIFFWKMFEMWWRFHKWNKNSRKFFFFLRELDFNRERQILTIRNRILVIGSPCVNKNPMNSNFNQGDIFQIISPHSDEKIW